MSEYPFIVAGGFGYDERRNAVVSEYVRSLGHTALPPMSDPLLEGAPKAFTIRTADGAERTVRRQHAYFLAPKPEVTLVSSQFQEWRADELIAHIEKQGRGPVNGIFQSADAQNGLIAVHKRPDLFRNIVLAFPAGLVKKQSSTEYTRQMLRGAGRHRDESHLPAVPDDYEAATRPKTVRERREGRRFSKSGGFAVASSVTVAYHNSLLSELRRQEDAPGIALVLGLKDSMMQPGRIIESLHSPDDVDYIFITNSKHGWNGSKKRMDDTLALFPLMEEITARRNAGQDIGPLSKRIAFGEGVSETDKKKILELVSKLDEKHIENS